MNHNNILSPTIVSPRTQGPLSGLNQAMMRNSQVRNKRSLNNYRFLKNNFFTTNGEPINIQEQKQHSEQETQNNSDLKHSNPSSRLQRGHRRLLQKSFETTKPSLHDGNMMSTGSINMTFIASPRNQLLSPTSPSNVTQNFRGLVSNAKKGGHSKVRQGNQQPHFHQLNEQKRRGRNVEQSIDGLKVQQFEMSRPSEQTKQHRRITSDVRQAPQILSARGTQNQNSKRNLLIQKSTDKLKDPSEQEIYTQRRRINQYPNGQNTTQSRGLNNSLSNEGKRFSSSFQNIQPSPKRRNMIIEEASEREELTVQEMIDNKIEFPLTPKDAVAQYSQDYLTEFETTEILEYEKVFYMSYKDNKLNPTKTERLVNNGFDDPDGYYKIVIGDQLGYRFQVLDLIGKGAFGQVVKCFDHREKQLVAMKLVKNQKKYYYQAAVEAKLLLLLKENDPENKEHVVKIKDYFVFRNHLCMTFDLYSINLYEFIKMYDYSGFQEGLIRRFAIQLLCALKYLKTLGVVHCDLKPENILLKQKDKSGIVIADFGSGTIDNEIVYTYIQSRFYRAPDIMLGLFPYTQGIDMWSFGCIMIELFTGFPLFPGTNEREQLQLIIDVIGMPPSNVVSISQRKHLFSQFKDNAVPAPSEVLTQEQKEERLRYIMVKLRDVPDDSFVNFIGQCLEWDPKKRLTPEAGLKHEWVMKGLPSNVLVHHQRMQTLGNHEATRNKLNPDQLKANNSIRSFVNQDKPANYSINQKFQIYGNKPNPQVLQSKNLNHKQLLKRLIGNDAKK